MHFFTGSFRSAGGRRRCVAAVTPARAADALTIEDRFAEVNRTRLHYLVAGAGKPVIPAARLCPEQPYVAPADRRARQDQHCDRAGPARLRRLGQAGERLRQEDDGAGHPRARGSAGPEQVSDRRSRHRADGRLCLCRAVSGRRRPHRADGCIPARRRRLDKVWLLRDLWHFHFYGKTPLALVEGRERIYFEHFWNDFAADPTQVGFRGRSPVLRKAYAQPGAMRAGFEVFRAFEQDARDFAGFAETKLTMPMLVLTARRRAASS